MPAIGILSSFKYEITFERGVFMSQAPQRKSPEFKLSLKIDYTT